METISLLMTLSKCHFS